MKSPAGRKLANFVAANTHEPEDSPRRLLLDCLREITEDKLIACSVGEADVDDIALEDIWIVGVLSGQLAYSATSFRADEDEVQAAGDMKAAIGSLPGAAWWDESALLAATTQSITTFAALALGKNPLGLTVAKLYHNPLFTTAEAVGILKTTVRNSERRPRSN